MGPGRDRTRDPWICSQTRYRLRYATRHWCVCVLCVCMVFGGDSGGCGSGCGGGDNQLLHKSIFALLVKFRHVR